MYYRIGIIILSLLLGGPIHATGLTIPVKYLADYGVYTQEIHIGHDQLAHAIVDTGSASLVLVGDESYCPACSHALTKGAINPSKLTSPFLNQIYTLIYGSAYDKVGLYEAPIIIEKKTVIPMRLFVVKESTQPSSVVGLIHHTLHSEEMALVPYIVKMTDNFKKYDEISFVFCANRGKSYYHIGPLPLPHPIASADLEPSPFYQIATSGFYDNQHRPIATTPQSRGAILDTGTGGFFILSAALYEPLYQYLYQHAGAKNQALPKPFWQNNDCVLQNEVDLKAFPTIHLGIIDKNTGKNFYLKLGPETYISSAGCGQGYYRFVFNKDLPPAHPTAIKNHQSRTKLGVYPDMILGSTLFNHYVITFHYKPQPFVSFYADTNLCHP